MPFFGPCHCFFVLFFPPAIIPWVNLLVWSILCFIWSIHSIQVEHQIIWVQTHIQCLIWVLWWQKCLSYQQCRGLACVGLDTIAFHQICNLTDLSEFLGKDNWLLERLSCSMDWWCRQDECWSSTGPRHLLCGPAQPRRDTRALQSWRRCKLKKSLVQCFLAIMATFLYSEGKNISCLQYKSLQKRSYTHLASLTPKEPPFHCLMCVLNAQN